MSSLQSSLPKNEETYYYLDTSDSQKPQLYSATYSTRWKPLQSLYRKFQRNRCFKLSEIIDHLEKKYPNTTSITNETDKTCLEFQGNCMNFERLFLGK